MQFCIYLISYLQTQMLCKAVAQPEFEWSIYITEMCTLSFGSHFEMLSCFILGKCSVNHAQSRKPVEDNKWTRDFKSISSDSSSWTFGDSFIRTSIDGVVKFKENYFFCGVNALL